MMKCVIGENRAVREVFDVPTKDLFSTKKRPYMNKGFTATIAAFFAHTDLLGTYYGVVRRVVR